MVEVRRLLGIDSVEKVKVKAEKAEKVKAEKAVKVKAAAKIVPVLPESEDGAIPEESDYRIPADSIDTTVCVGRRLKQDKRWKPIIHGESQCGGALIEGSDLCKVCSRREQKYEADPTSKSGWDGRVTEDPMDWHHMLGTAWAEKAKPVFNGSASASASVAGGSVSDGSAEEMPVADSKKAAAAEKKAAAEAAKAEKAAAAEAAKAEKAAAAEAAKAEKAAAKAEKEAAKAEKAKVSTPAKDKAKAKSGGAAPTAPKKAAKVAVVPEPVKTEGSLQLIDGETYNVRDGNVYEYDALTETVGSFVGRLLSDETIDPDAEEVNPSESESE